MARLVVLNGASSSGKSSIARCLQATWPTTLLHVGVDTVIAMWPAPSPARPGHPAGDFVPRPPEPTGAERAPPFLPRWSPAFRGLLLDAHRHWGALWAAGWDLVVDHVLFDEAVRDDARRAFAGALWVGVTCPVPVLEARERGRPDRDPGIAAGTAALVHEGMDYDLVVDTGARSAAECAAQVLGALGA